MTDFEVQSAQADDVAILRLKGYLDAHTVPRFEAAIAKLVKEGQYRILVDMENLEYISSAGLGVFMGFIEEVREKNGDIKLCNLTDKVFRVFDLLGFPTLFDILKTEREALEKFKATE
ncbi:MAG TPA: anti-sigma factor antagonist [Caldithrix abyssi]|uniref:Anti-sigma factor antagonist n=1 Tax=Caldithrix abyssi TaxID=187145 RepID=A0A7V5UFG5_CALAY|nr:anti-sigma factor antagonist [Caldithrix abyssi]